MILGTAATNILILLINLVTSILAARLLGPEGRGGLAIVLLYPQMVATIGLLGVDRSMSILGGRRTLDSAFGSIIAYTLLLSFPIMLIAYVIVIHLVTDLTLVQLSLTYIWYIPPLYFFMLSIALLNGVGKFVEYNIARFTFYISYLVLIVAFWIARFLDLQDFVYANLLSLYVTAVVTGLLLLRARTLKMPSSVKSVAVDCAMLARKAAIFIIPGGLAVVAARLDQVILTNYLDLKAVGLFVVYLAFSQLIGPVANAINVNIFHLSIVDSKSNIPRLIRISNLTYSIGLIGMAVIAPIVVRVFYGESYLEDIQSARLLLIASFFFFSSQLFNEFMKGRSIVRQDVVSQLIYIVALIGSAVLMVPRLAILGMAGAMVVANFGRWLYLIVMFGNTMQIRLLDLLVTDHADLQWLLNKGKMAARALRP